MNDTDSGAKPFHIWEGVYNSFEAATEQAVGLGFRGEVYSKRSYMVAKVCLAALKTGQPIPQFHKQRSTFLPCTVAMMLSIKAGIRVLDSVGGLGTGYMTLVESIPNNAGSFKYFILENPEISALGAELLGGSVTYLPEFPLRQYFDLVHAASSLQYIDRWRCLVESIASIRLKYIIFSDVFAGAIESYVGLQNYYDNKIPHWFLNLQELLECFERHGYSLAMKSYTASPRLGVEDVLQMDNFPEALRLPQSLHLLLQTKA